MHCSCNIVVKCVAQIHLTVKIYIYIYTRRIQTYSFFSDGKASIAVGLVAHISSFILGLVLILQLRYYL